MPRIETTRTVKIALMVLRVYLIAMLALILVGFWRHRNNLRSVIYPTASQAAVTTAQPASATTEK
ncbi:MAG TPA: hypothetical protein VHP11_12180 [Tepidisphaeraceae bacterium]|nr:hypothetical protein [Tepidisphaeraceae bacterium]